MDRSENPSGVDMQAISSAVCGAVVSAFSGVLNNRNPQAGQNGGQSSAGAVRPQPTIQTIHPSVSGAITRFVLYLY